MFTVAIFYSVLEVLQSDFVGENVSKTINKALQSEYGVSVNFQKAKFQLFPPGIEVKNVSVHDLKHNEYSFQSSKIGAYFDLRDIFLDKPTISELLVFDALVELNFEKKKEINKGEKNDEEKKLDSIEVTKYIKLIESKLPIDFKKINLSQSKIAVNNSSIELRSLLLKKRKRDLKVKLTSYNLDLRGVNHQIPVIDTVSMTVVLDDNEIDIKNSSVKKGVNEISVSGEFLNDLTHIAGKGKLDLKGEISDLKNYVDLTKVGNLEKGVLDLSGKFSIENNRPTFESEIQVSNFITDFCYGDELNFKISGDDKSIRFDKFFLKAQKQSIQLLESFEFYNLKSNKFVEEDILVSVNSLQLNNALRYLKSLSILKGEMSGKIRFRLLEKSFHFLVEDKVEINNLYLGDKQKPILSVENGVLNKTNFSVINGNFQMNSLIELPNSSLIVKGEITKDDMNFKIQDAEVDFSDFGKFAGLSILGNGKLDLDVYKNKEKEDIILLKPNLNSFSFENYQLGETRGSIYFNLSRSEIAAKDIIGKQGKAILAGEALINYGNGDVEANLNLISKRYVDVKKVLFPLLSPLSFIPDDVFGDWKINAKVNGKMNLDDLIVEMSFDGKNNYIYDESFESIFFRLSLMEQVLNIKDIKANKSTGQLRGEYSFNLKNKKMLYDLRFANIPLRDINLVDRSPIEIDANINGYLKGEDSEDKKLIQSKLELEDTYVSSRKIRDSEISIEINNEDYVFDANFFGDEIKFAGNLFTDKNKTSKLDLAINTKDIPLYLSILKFVDKSTLNMNGEVKLYSKLDFPGTSFKDSNFNLKLDKFVFKKESVDISYNYNKEVPQFIIDKGVVKNWDLEIEGRKFYLISKGSGNLAKNYEINNDFKVDASILETFNKIVSSANGTMRGKVKFFNNGEKSDYEATLISNNISLSTTYLPTEIKDTKLYLEYKQNRILLKQFRAGLSAGFVDVSGNINLKNFIPELNMKMIVNEAGIPILGKSSLVISGDTTLVGKKPPYSLAGDIVINKLLIVNDIQDFTSGDDAILKKEYDYLPQQDTKVFNNFLSLNLNIDTKEPMMISNSFADIGMVGDLQLLGGENDPKLVGSLSLAPRTNKITFKNIDYLLNKGNVYFYSQNKISNPELDFIADSTINDYKVNLKVYGPVSDFKLDLTSTPALSQEDILSLIAFGYTKDLSANLSDAERESMTQAGVGSILFDSFKINETLKSEFGLQVNLGTQIQQDETSLLNQRNSDGTRVRSATTIEVKKKLNEAMNLSVSSTVGGSAGQKQSMNLNYNISNKVSVEGVYETRTAPEGEEAIINDTSFGADVKVRWSFK